MHAQPAPQDLRHTHISTINDFAFGTIRTKAQKSNSRDPRCWARKLVSLLWIEHSTSRFSD